jgi:hypothetical protein
LNPGQRILGITKYLISDFVVNEIDELGKVVVFNHKPDLNKAQQQPKQENTVK